MKWWTVGMGVAIMGVAVVGNATLPQYLGTYVLVAESCPGLVPTSVEVLDAVGQTFVKTSDGYVYSGTVGGSGAVAITNGPRTICSGNIVSGVFGGHCVDTTGVTCAVQYQK